MSGTGVFNGEMLRLARGAQGRTQSELAIDMSISQAKISKWEDGLREPSQEEASQLALQLNVPIKLFYLSEQVFGFGTCCLYHRKKKALSINLLNSIHDKINILRIGIARLLRNAQLASPCEVTHHDVDDYDSPALIAEVVRAQWQLPIGPVRNLVAAVESAGGIVVEMNFGTPLLDAVSQWPRGMPPLFFVNTIAPADRRRFSLAHEVGHIVMHRTPTPDAEPEADNFAAALLMPAREIRMDLEGLTIAKAARLKLRWRVSMQAIMYRARELNVIPQAKYRSLFMYLSKLGYRKHEPHPIDEERATTLQSLVNLHVSELGYSMQELRELLFCDEHTLNEVYLRGNNSPTLRVIRE